LPIAERLLSEGRFNGPDSRPDSKVPLGYPAFLALVKKVYPSAHLLAVVCIQVALDGLVAVLIYALAWLVASPRAGLLAGIGWLVYPPALAMSTWITAENLFTVLFVLSTLLLVYSLKQPGVRWSLAAGLVLGIATLVRGTCLWLPLFLLPLWCRRSLPQGKLKGAAFLAGMLCCVVPWTIRNQLVLGDPILVSVGSGSVFLQGSDERVFTIAGKQAYYPAMVADAQKAGLEKPPEGAPESAIDSWLLKLGLRNYQLRLHERPWSFFPFLLHKFLRLWYGTESGRTFQQIGLGLCSAVVVPLALWQSWRWRTDQPHLAWLLGLLVLYFVGLHWATLPEYRYLHPLFPLLILAASQAVVTRFSRARAQPGPSSRA
jgi:4-amino-4-deoxy-L-arabinose transferase-like glycosyltransferase